MTLGEFIKQYRAEHKMSVRAFAVMTDLSPQQISNIENGIGNNGKPMTSTMKTYQKVANGIGMKEQDFLNMLNDNVLINPSEENDPATESDGNILDLSKLSKTQISIILDVIKSDDHTLSVARPKIESLLFSQQVPDDSQ